MSRTPGRMGSDQRDLVEHALQAAIAVDVVHGEPKLDVYILGDRKGCPSDQVDVRGPVTEADLASAFGVPS